MRCSGGGRDATAREQGGAQAQIVSALAAECLAVADLVKVYALGAYAEVTAAGGYAVGGFAGRLVLARYACCP